MFLGQWQEMTHLHDVIEARGINDVVKLSLLDFCNLHIQFCILLKYQYDMMCYKICERGGQILDLFKYGSLKSTSIIRTYPTFSSNQLSLNILLSDVYGNRNSQQRHILVETKESHKQKRDNIMIDKELLISR